MIIWWPQNSLYITNLIILLIVVVVIIIIILVPHLVLQSYVCKEWIWLTSGCNPDSFILTTIKAVTVWWNLVTHGWGNKAITEYHGSATPQGSGTKVYKKNIEKNALLTHSLCIVQLTYFLYDCQAFKPYTFSPNCTMQSTLLDSVDSVFLFYFIILFF
jgi:hypothetical protein